MITAIPLGLYIHTPWCVEKCPYCDFNSHELKTELPEKEYAAQLLRNLEEQLPWVWGRRIESIFIGGGTPSLFSAQFYEQLLSEVRARLALQANLEITLESNPGTADAKNYAGYRAAGINRISIGVQSFHPEHLKRLGRIHSAEQAIIAINMAKDSGFTRINGDLMFGLGGQSVAEAISDLEQLIALGVEHISWYQLTIEPNTAYYSAPPKNIPDDDNLVEIQEQGRQLLEAEGYHQYEVSAWAKPGAESRHNLNYWQFGDYLGIGAGAHGKITDFNEQQVYRTRNKKQPHHWLTTDSDLLAERKAIAKADLPLEFFMNALRLRNGVPKSLLYEHTGLQAASIAKQLQQAIELGLLSDDLDRYLCTAKGYYFLNDVLELFMPNEQLILQTKA
ncbi:MAG: radical SAM family heme chaperone HemW [Gammaproteobacteria bacterium]|nr:radical SAM family heme chaperone HemW [Gammaproteobacteria bacterium]NNJ72868.1 radical SAM family heme chaperone HemW [Enterobacterales bacterium]